MKNEERGTIRVNKSRDFSVIHNSGLRDPRLSYGARGVLAYLLTKPDDWELRVEDLVCQSPQGEHAVRQMLRELKHFGYLKRERKPGKGGRFEWATVIYEVSQKPDETRPHKPRKKPSRDTSSDVAELQPQHGAQVDDAPSGDFPQMVEIPPSGDFPDVVFPDVENHQIYKRLSEEELSEETLKEGGCAGVGSHNSSGVENDATPARPPIPSFSTPSSLSPDPREAPDLMALKEECNVSLIRPSTKDRDFWPDAVATVRDTLPETDEATRAKAVRDFKADWCQGGRRGNLYLSQVVTHFPRWAKNERLVGNRDASIEADPNEDPHTAMKRRALARMNGHAPSGTLGGTVKP